MAFRDCVVMVNRCEAKALGCVGTRRLLFPSSMSLHSLCVRALRSLSTAAHISMAAHVPCQSIWNPFGQGSFMQETATKPIHNPVYRSHIGLVKD
eukprot:788865-Pelagomonas_calceolata.AAC.5